MASHGVPRATVKEVQTKEARDKELKEINKYQTLVEGIHRKVDAKEFDPELLEQTSTLLKLNPEYYTIWNLRRQIYTNEFSSLRDQVSSNQLEPSSQHSQILDIIRMDLSFLFPLLLQYPKCYWIWNHRLWLLQQATTQLPASKARPLWEQELELVGKMLMRDSRNFHGWGYRQTVIDSLESDELGGHSMSRAEYNYTTKKIEQNLSNFSAWHTRSRLILKILDEEQATDEQRKKMLEDEIEYIHQALVDPYDQSLWFYHQNLMSNFDPDTCRNSIAPNLSRDEKLAYIDGEREHIMEMIEDALDCKWIYQALIDCALIEKKLDRDSNARPEMIAAWLRKIRELDPLRTGRWSDVEKRLLQS